MGLSDDSTILVMNYVCLAKEKTINGSTRIVKLPTGKLTGLWVPINAPKTGKISRFTLKHYPCEMLRGHLDSPEWCSLQGWMEGVEVVIRQRWGKRSPYE